MQLQQTRLTSILLMTGAVTVPGHAQVVSCELLSDPVSEGWDLFQKLCAQTWVDDDWYFQEFDPQTCGVGQDAYVRSITEFNSEPEFFLEFRVQTSGDRSEIPRGAPALISMFNFFGVVYHTTIARDLVKFARDLDDPIWFIEIEPDVPHTYRIELYRDWYVFYIDADVLDQGAPDGPFPAHDARITWLGRAWDIPCENAWDYIRYGVIPVDGSGNYDSNEDVDARDYYFFHECLGNERVGINGGPDEDAGPGCRFADFDADADVDLQDVAVFQQIFTGSE